MKKTNDVFIHVGLPKTGTTWIQREIFEKMKNVNYYHRFDLYTPLDFDKKTVISNEELAGVAYWEKGMDIRYQVIERLYRMFPKAKIIVGRRDERSWIRSTYAQYVKNGGWRNFDSWFDFCYDKKAGDMDSYESYIYGLFGKKNVFVYDISDLKTDISGFVTRLCGFIGEPVPPYSMKQYNKKLNWHQLIVLRYINIWFRSKENKTGLLPGVLGYWIRWCMLHASGGWQQ